MVGRTALLRRVRRVLLVTSTRVAGTVSGRHRSIFVGNGLELADLREYQPGDDLRAIDWKVTARYARPYVREFVEDREQTFYLVIDRSGSTGFGAERAKAERIAELAASLLVSAIENRERVGLCLFSDRIERFIPARGGKTQVARILGVLADPAPPQSIHTSIGGVLGALARRLPRRCTVILVSDLLDTGFAEPLRLLARRHEVIVVRVVDPREERLPDVGVVRAEDAETGEQCWVDTGNPVVRSRFAERAAAFDADLTRVIRRAGARAVICTTDEPLERVAARLFARRGR
ncbi:MAG: DUF58 domain-containing protein [Methanospirillum sp.]|nr:DUF58 domain-containing protein [Methanospirillum sp.]